MRKQLNLLCAGNNFFNIKLTGGWPHPLRTPLQRPNYNFLYSSSCRD